MLNMSRPLASMRRMIRLPARPGLEAPAWPLARPRASRLVLTRIEIGLPGLPGAFDGYRIAHLSDLHFGPALALNNIRRALEIAHELHTDLMVITGDFVTSRLDQDLLPRALRRLRARDGVWAVLGNHDHATDAPGLRRILQAHGVRELCNTAACLDRGGQALWLAGVDDILAQQHDLTAALAGVPDGATTVLLAHEPDFADEVAATGRVALQLSGHTHGGLVRLPDSAPILPGLLRMARKYPRGLYRVGQMSLFTNTGIGHGSIPRFHVLPEVAEITLRAA